MPKFYSQLYGLTSLISFPSNICPTLPSSRLPFLVWPEVQAMFPSSATHLPWLHLHLGPGARRTEEEQSSGDSSSVYSGQREGLPSLSVSGAQLAALLSLCCHDHFCCVDSGWEVRAGNTLKLGLCPRLCLLLVSPLLTPHSSSSWGLSLCTWHEFLVLYFLPPGRVTVERNNGELAGSVELWFLVFFHNPSATVYFSESSGSCSRRPVQDSQRDRQCTVCLPHLSWNPVHIGAMFIFISVFMRMVDNLSPWWMVICIYFLCSWPQHLPHWVSSSYFIALKSCLYTQDTYSLSEISHVYLPSWFYIVLLCLWYFHHAKCLYFLYTQGNPPCYSQTHHIFFYTIRFFFLFLKRWNLSSYTVVRNGFNSSCGYPVTRCYSSSPSFFWYWRWCPYSILTFQVQLCLFLDFLFSPVSLSIPALTLYSYNYRGLMVCFHIWQTSPPPAVPLFLGFLGYFFFPDKLCNQLAYP